jgi:type IV secretory pathway VirB9-like protein
MKYHMKLAAIVLSASLLGAGSSEAKHPRHKPLPSKPAPAGPSTALDAEPGAKIIHYGSKDVVKLNTKVRFTTLIELPKDEQILDFVCGDKDLWVINGNQNFAYVKPAKEGITTNLNLITASGNIYTFVLIEISPLSGVQPDLKVFVQPKEESMISAAQRAPRFVPAHELDACKQDLKSQQEQFQRALDSELAKQMASLHFGYRFLAEKAPFHVSTIYHDRKFTYIVAKPDETSTLYELRDNKPNLINFSYKDGVFTAEKVIDRGYLAIGKQRFFFFMKGD